VDIGTEGVQADNPPLKGNPPFPVPSLNPQLMGDY
jgi:hypothetical protein